MKTVSTIVGSPIKDVSSMNDPVNGVNSTLAEPLKHGSRETASMTVLAASAGASARSADLISPAQVTPPRWTVEQTERRLREAERLRRERLDRSKVRSGLYPVGQVFDIARKGLGRGYRQTGATRGEWDISGTCENPRAVQLDGAACRLAGGRYVRASGRPLSVTLYTRCRRCGPCLGRRRNLWAARARDEVAMSTRTWFATLTLAPSAHWHLECRASARLTEGGVDLRKLPPDERFAEIVKEYAEELTKFMKRVRKNSGAILRYLLVAERHKSGKPHFHALIHEIGTDVPIRHTVLRSAWKLGFTKFKLVERDVKACWYVSKYLAKDVASRVRASLGYGRGADLNKHATKSHSFRTTNGETWPPAPPPLTKGREEHNNLQNVVLEKPINQEVNYNELPNDIQRERFARDKAAYGSASSPRASAGLRSGAGAGSSDASPPLSQCPRAKSRALQSIQALCAAFGAGGVRYSASARSFSNQCSG